MNNIVFITRFILNFHHKDSLYEKYLLIINDFWIYFILIYFFSFAIIIVIYQIDSIFPGGKDSILFKIVFVVAVSVLVIAFSTINKDNFTTVSVVVTLMTFMCTPENIVNILLNNKDIIFEASDIKISVQKIFILFRYYLLLLYVIWGNVVFLIRPEPNKSYIYIYIYIVIICCIRTFIINYYIYQ